MVISDYALNYFLEVYTVPFLETANVRTVTGTVTSSIVEQVTSIASPLSIGTTTVTNSGSVTLSSVSTNLRVGTVTDSLTVSITSVPTNVGISPVTGSLNYGLNGIISVVSPGSIDTTESVIAFITSTPTRSAPGAVNTSYGSTVSISTIACSVTPGAPAEVVSYTLSNVFSEVRSGVASTSIVETITTIESRVDAGIVIRSGSAELSINGLAIPTSPGAVNSTEAITSTLSGISVTVSPGSVNATEAVAESITTVSIPSNPGAVTITNSGSVILSGISSIVSPGTTTRSYSGSVTITSQSFAAAPGTVDGTEQVIYTLTNIPVSVLVGSLNSTEVITEIIQGISTNLALGTVNTTEAVIESISSIGIPVVTGSVDNSEIITVTLQTLSSAVAPGSIDVTEAVLESITGITLQSIPGSVTRDFSAAVSINSIASVVTPGTLTDTLTYTLTSTSTNGRLGALSLSLVDSITSVSTNIDASGPTEQVTVLLSNVAIPSAIGQTTRINTGSPTLSAASVPVSPGSVDIGEAVTVSITGVSISTPQEICYTVAPYDYWERTYSECLSSSVTISIGEFLDSVAVPNRLGVFSVDRVISVNGTSAATSPGSVLESLDESISSIDSNLNLGTPLESITYTLAGVSSTPVAGTVDRVNSGVASLNSISSTVLLGKPTGVIAESLNSVSSALLVNNVASAVGEFITNISVEARPGALTDSIGVFITNVSLNGNTGTVTLSYGASVSITSISTNVVTGDVLESVSYSLSALQTSSEPGNLTEAPFESVISISSGVEIGSPTESITYSLTGISIVPAPGIPLESISVSLDFGYAYDYFAENYVIVEPLVVASPGEATFSTSPAISISGVDVPVGAGTPLEAVSYSLSSITAVTQPGNVNEEQVEAITSVSTNIELGLPLEAISYTLTSTPINAGIGTVNESHGGDVTLNAVSSNIQLGTLSEAGAESLDSISSQSSPGTVQASVVEQIQSIDSKAVSGTPLESIEVSLDFGYAYDYFAEYYVAVDPALTLNTGTASASSSPLITLSGISTNLVVESVLESIAYSLTSISTNSELGTVTELPTESVTSITSNVELGAPLESLSYTLTSLSSSVGLGAPQEALSVSLDYGYAYDYFLEEYVFYDYSISVVTGGLPTLRDISGIVSISSLGLPLEQLAYTLPGLETRPVILSDNESLLEAIQGIAIRGDLGSITGSVSETLDGISSRTVTGNVQSSQIKDLSGQVLLNTLGILTESIEVTLASQLINGQVGSIADKTEEVTGVSSNLNLGAVFKEQSFTLLFQQISSALGNVTTNIAYLLDGSNISSNTGVVNLGGFFSPTSANLGVYEVNELVNANIAFFSGSTYLPVTLTVSANATYSNSITNTTEVGPTPLSNTIVIVDNVTQANITGYFDAPQFNQSYIEYVSINTHEVIRIDSKDYGNIWAEFDTRVDDVLEITTFKADSREYITFEITASVPGDTKVYTITVLHPDYSIERDILRDYVAVT